MQTSATSIHLENALMALLARYVKLVNDGGFWDPEAEDEVINARKALGLCFLSLHPSKER